MIIIKFPSNRNKLLTEAGTAYFQKMDILGGIMWYTYEDNPSNFISISVEDVNKILELNAENKKAESLEEYTEMEVEEQVKFDNVIGQDDLTRFDSKEKSKRKNSKNSKRNNQSKNKNKQKTANNDNRAQKTKVGNKPTNKFKKQDDKANQSKSNAEAKNNRPKRKFRPNKNNNSKPKTDSKV